MIDRYDRFRNQNPEPVRNAAGVRFFGIYADPGADDLAEERRLEQLALAEQRRLELLAIGKDLQKAGIPIQLRDGSLRTVEEDLGRPAREYDEPLLDADFVQTYLDAKENKNLRGVAVHYTIYSFDGMHPARYYVPNIVHDMTGDDTASEKKYGFVYRGEP